MIRLCLNVAYSGRTEIVIFDEDHLPDAEKGIMVQISLNNKLRKREAINELNKIINKSDVKWIRPGNNLYNLDLDLAKSEIESLKKYDWLKGMANVRPEIEYEETETFGEPTTETLIRLCIYEEEFLLTQNTKIFLSHKGKNKPWIRQFNNTLKIIGLETWLDEDLMPAGTEIDRGLLKGMQESCAVVFFITPDFIDAEFLETEIDYAIAEKRKKKERFSIITMVLTDKNGKKGDVPDLLKRYVWKEPDSDLECLQEIIKALPIKMENINWKV